ncbi:hypothetical protein [Vulcanococcus limneticus]|uniref:tellurite resistance TerB family protein n=1 Tax=Vulcanococcus limneticus TaxID=2170428 RepID=UPI00398BE252
MAPSSDPGADRQLTLLKIACSVAWADGEVSPEERSLLLKLVARYFPREPGQESLEAAAEQLAAWAQDGALLDGLIARLESEEDRLLAAKLGYLIARVGQRPGDTSPINSEEKLAYRRLVEGLGLGEGQIQEVEWASEQELSAQKGLWGVLGSLFGDLGNWPTREMLESPGVQWL